MENNEDLSDRGFQELWQILEDLETVPEYKKENMMKIILEYVESFLINVTK